MVQHVHHGAGGRGGYGGRSRSRSPIHRMRSAGRMGYRPTGMGYGMEFDGPDYDYEPRGRSREKERYELEAEFRLRERERELDAREREMKMMNSLTGGGVLGSKPWLQHQPPPPQPPPIQPLNLGETPEIARLKNEISQMRLLYMQKPSQNQQSSQDDYLWGDLNRRLDKLERNLEMAAMKNAHAPRQGSEESQGWRSDLDRLRREVLDTVGMKGRVNDDRDWFERIERERERDREDQAVRELREAVSKKDREIDQMKQTAGDMRRDFDREIDRLRTDTQRPSPPQPVVAPQPMPIPQVDATSSNKRFTEEFSSQFRKMTDEITGSLLRSQQALGGSPMLNGGAAPPPLPLNPLNPLGPQVGIGLESGAGAMIDTQLHQANQAAEAAAAAARAAQKAAVHINSMANQLSGPYDDPRWAGTMA